MKVVPCVCIKMFYIPDTTIFVVVIWGNKVYKKKKNKKNKKKNVLHSNR